MLDAAGKVRADLAPEVVALADQLIEISGFIAPAGFVALADGIGEFRRFKLSRYAPDCPFCPAAGPTEMIEVACRELVAPTKMMVSALGLFATQDRMDKGAFYKMSEASIRLATA